MTKKMENIVKKYEERMDLVVFAYRENLTTFEKAIKEVDKEEEQFDQLITGMYFYNLISEKDMRESMSIRYDVWDKTRDKLYDEKFKKVVEVA